MKREDTIIEYKEKWDREKEKNKIPNHSTIRQATDVPIEMHKYHKSEHTLPKWSQLKHIANHVNNPWAIHNVISNILGLKSQFVGCSFCWVKREIATRLLMLLQSSRLGLKSLSVSIRMIFQERLSLFVRKIVHQFPLKWTSQIITKKKKPTKINQCSMTQRRKWSNLKYDAKCLLSFLLSACIW